MKIESAQFAIDRLKSSGMHPVYLWRFPTNAAYFSTRPITTTLNTYTERVLSFSPISFRFESGGNFGGVAGCQVTLVRATDTNFLLSAVVGGNPVEVDMAFYKDSSIATADQMPIARFLIARVSAATQATITLDLLADERKLIFLPKNLFTEVTVLPEESKKLFVPYILGKGFINENGANNKMGQAKSHNFIPCVLANTVYNAAHTYGTVASTDVGEWIVGENAVGGLSDFTVNKVYQFYDGISCHAELAAAPANGIIPPQYNTFTASNTNNEQYTPGLNTAKLRCDAHRILSRPVEINAPLNTLGLETAGTKYTWRNVTNDDWTDVSRVEAGLNPARNILAVGWSLQSLPTVNQAPIFGWYYIRIDNADKTTGGGTRLTIKDALWSNGVLSGGGTFDITSIYGFPLEIWFGPLGVATVIGNSTFGTIGFDFDKVFLQITCSGVTTTSTQFAEISAVGVQFGYTDQSAYMKKQTNFVARKVLRTDSGDFVPINRYFSAFGMWTNPGLNQVFSTKTTTTVGSRQTMFADVNGPSTITGDPGISWQNPGATPPWIAYGILKNILGYSTAEIDGTGFERLDNFLFNTGSGFSQSVLIKDQTAAQDILRGIAYQCDSAIFYSGDGQWKFVPHAQYLTLVFPSYNAPVTQFSDNAGDYIIQDLTWSIIEPQFNKFKVRYQFDYARSDYFGVITRDETATVPNGIEAAVVEAPYIREATTAQEFINRLALFARKKRRLVSFNTTLAAVALEIGDFIKIQHATLPDNTPRYQIQEVEYSGATIKITAMEI